MFLAPSFGATHGDIFGNDLASNFSCGVGRVFSSTTLHTWLGFHVASISFLLGAGDCSLGFMVSVFDWACCVVSSTVT